MKSQALVMGFAILGSCCCFVVDCRSVEMQQDGKRSGCVVGNERVVHCGKAFVAG